MRRRSVDHLVPNEQRTLRAALQLHQQDITQFHGYLLAKQLKSRSAGSPVMAYSTVYRCLDRLEERDLIASFEAHDGASGGPPRRMFELTERGLTIVSELPADDEARFQLDAASPTQSQIPSTPPPDNPREPT